MSLANLNIADAADKGRTMIVLHPTDRVPLKGANGEGVSIDLLGMDSDAWIASEHAIRNRNIDAMRNGQKFSAADVDKAAGDALAGIVTGWSNIPVGWLTPNGTSEEAAPFTLANARLLLNNRGVRWLREQVDAFVGQRAGFLTT
jgi:hypothetical protein